MAARLLFGKYNCIGRVTNTGVRRDSDAPPIWYDKNNPTGYLTGQWIDVQVTEATDVPAKYSQKIFQENELIEGFWAYGGDNGISGNPARGDLVGYFEDRYAHVWEKIADDSAPAQRDREADTKLEPISGFSLLGVFAILCALLGLFAAALLISSRLGLEWASQFVRLPLTNLSFVVFTVFSLLFFFSSLAVLRRLEWGITGFTTACLGAFIGALYYLDLPVPVSVTVLLLPILLLVLESIHERGGALGIHLAHYLRKGMNAEEKEPKKALRYFEVLERRNMDTSPWILLACTILMPLAYWIALQVDQRLTRHNVLISLLILSVVGLAPALYLVYQKKERKKNPYSGRPDSKSRNLLLSIVSSFFVMVLVIFGDVLILAFLLVISLLIVYLVAAPIYFISQRLHNPSWEAFGTLLQAPWGYTLVIFLAVLLFLNWFGGVRYMPFSLKRILQEIPIGVRENAEDMFTFLSNLTTTYLVTGMISARYEFLYTDPIAGLILYAFAGAMFGWEACRETSDANLHSLNVIARARCLGRLGKRLYGEFILYLHLRELNTLTGAPVFIKELAAAQMELLSEEPNHLLAEHHLEGASSSLPRYVVPQQDVYETTIEKIQAQTSPSLMYSW